MVNEMVEVLHDVDNKVATGDHIRHVRNDHVRDSSVNITRVPLTTAGSYGVVPPRAW